ncbi:MAG TPA: alpha/beta fold hydrolase [Solirubrobacteraceae bacterium]|jgi:haloalkane dehalogenase
MTPPDVHFVDDGDGPPLLLLHGNPTSSYLYRKVIAGLRDRFRCIAPDYPGFGRSVAPPGYGFTPVEHAAVIERLVVELGLEDVTMMVQDWGGPIGFAVAGRHPSRFSRFVIGNTWAWPKADLGTRLFSGFLGGPIGKQLILRRNFFVTTVMKRSQRRPFDVSPYERAFPTVQSRIPAWVFPREITGSLAFLRGVEEGLSRVADRPALILWPDGDVAFRAPERERWESIFPDHETVTLEGVGHYIQEEAPDEIVDAIRSWSPRTT